MNRTNKDLFLVFCTAASALSALPVAAQSNVTLFGVADSAVRYVKNENVGSITSLVSGANQTSRLGFRGLEDLGGGLSAGFHIESGIALDTGAQTTATQFWDRRATVSLLSKAAGEIRLGRDFVPAYTSWGRHDPFGYVGVASSGTFISTTPVGPIRSAYGTAGGNTTVRSSNAVQYITPSGLAGFEGALMVAAGEGGTAANGQHKLVGGRVGYVSPMFGITVAHDRVENDLTTSGKHTDTVIGGNVAFSIVRLTAAARQFKYATAKQTNILVGANIAVGSGEIKASFNRANMQGRVGATNIDANDASQIGLGYVHNLSKRTALYTTASRISNKGVATFAVPGGPAGLAGGRDSTGFEAGLRHTF